MQGRSLCCEGTLKNWGRTARFEVDVCEVCGSFWPNTPLPGSGVKPWSESDITPEFSNALRVRRESQASEIVERFSALMRQGPVLDYGCGQGTFVSRALQAGIDAWACDLAIPDQAMAKKLGDHFVLIDKPWASPTFASGPSTWNMIVMLDVLEHHPTPTEFLRTLPPSKYLLIKVPLRTGPLGLGASTMAQLGRPGLLDSLFLVDDVAPHQVFFTSAGLVTAVSRAGWQLREKLMIADVGSELPERLRGNATAPAIIAPAIRAVGAAVDVASNWWSDTAVFLFERAAT